MVSLSVVLPAFDEARVVGSSLRRLTAYLEAESDRPGRPGGWSSWELVLVDDGSRDETVARALEAMAGDPRLVLRRHPSNRGKGAAVATGLEAARGARIVVTDVDLSFALEDIGAVAARLAGGPMGAHAAIRTPLPETPGGFDLVTGDRRHPDSRLDLSSARLPHVVRRQRLSALFNRGVRGLFGLASRDTQCGLKGFSRGAVSAILPRLRTRGFLADIEMLLIAERLGLRVGTIPVHLTCLSADSTVSVLRQWPAVMGDAMRIKLAQLRGLYG